MVIGFRPRHVGIGLFCFFRAAFVCLEDFFGLETDGDALGRVDVDILRLHDSDISLCSDLGV